MPQVNKEQLVEHLNEMITIERMREDERTAIVLTNLKQEIKDGEFDYGKPYD